MLGCNASAEQRGAPPSRTASWSSQRNSLWRSLSCPLILRPQFLLDVPGRDVLGPHAFIGSPLLVPRCERDAAPASQPPPLALFESFGVWEREETDCDAISNDGIEYGSPLGETISPRDPIDGKLWYKSCVAQRYRSPPRLIPIESVVSACDTTLKSGDGDAAGDSFERGRSGAAGVPRPSLLMGVLFIEREGTAIAP